MPEKFIATPYTVSDNFPLFYGRVEIRCGKLPGRAVLLVEI
jgi:hypothetical protein